MLGRRLSQEGEAMRLGVHGWKMGMDRDLETMIGICVESGMASFEIMEHPEFKSSVPLETPPPSGAGSRRPASR